MSTATKQIELFTLEEIEGYSELRPRERRFAEAIFSGCTSREAAKRAGIEGNENVVDATASRLLRSVKVQRVMNQAWAKSGASIDATLRQAAELQQINFAAAKNETLNLTERAAAFRRWRDASALIASINGKLVIVPPGAGVGVPIPPEALPFLAEMRRDVVRNRVGSSAPIVPVSAEGAN